MSVDDERDRLSSLFELDELDVTLVTGASGFGGGQGPDEKLWLASIPVTAWQQADGPIVREGPTSRLVALVDDDGLRELQDAIPKDSLVTVRVRRSSSPETRPWLLLVKLLAKRESPALEALLAEQVKPKRWATDLGEFVEDRSVHWYERTTQWLGRTIQVVVPADTPRQMTAMVATLSTVLADQPGWHDKATRCAAGHLLKLKNDVWLDEDEAPVSEDEFRARIKLTSINVQPRGGLEFWFDDDDLFWGHSILVTGSLQRGLTNAEMCG